MDKIYSHFSKTVDDYDTVADKVVFKNDELHNRLVHAIVSNNNRNLNVLDLGCGTGHGIELVAKLFPNATITGVDFSPKMIDKAKEKLSGFSKRVNFVEGDFNRIEFEKDCYDAVISAIAIHNSTNDQKKELFVKIFDSLKKGGLFINADFYKHESKELDNQIREMYRNFLKENLSGNELKVWLKHAFEEDIPMPLSQQFSLLREIGFTKLKLVWICNNEAIYVANKQ